MTTTPTNPAAIDLDDTELEPSDVERGEWQAGTRDYVERLEVVVEALRERVAEVEGEVEQAIKWQEYYMTKTEAAEARVVELAGAANKFLDNLKTWWDGPNPIAADEMNEAAQDLRATLATTPAKAMERAKAVDEATATLRSYYTAEMMGDALPTGGRAAALKEVGAFLAKLDALKP